MATATIQIEDHAAMWDRLAASPQWAALTASQKIWTVVRLATGSTFEATRTAYACSSEANTRVLSYEIAKNKSIVAAMAVATGETVETKPKNELDGLLRAVRRNLRAATPGSVSAQRLLAQQERLLLPGGPETGPAVVEDPATQTFRIGEIVTQDSAKYRIVAQEIE